MVFTNFVPFEEASRNAETQLYMNWLNQVKPGADPSFFGVFSWSAARLFAERATALGGKLTPSLAARVLQGCRTGPRTTCTRRRTSAAKRSGDCWRFITVKSSKWVPIGGTKYTCNGTTLP